MVYFAGESRSFSFSGSDLTDQKDLKNSVSSVNFSIVMVDLSLIL